MDGSASGSSKTDAFVSHVRDIKYGLVHEIAQCIRWFVHPVFSNLFYHMRNTRSSDTSQPDNEESLLLTSTMLPS